jgi:hypothetical protein
MLYNIFHAVFLQIMTLYIYRRFPIMTWCLIWAHFLSRSHIYIHIYIYAMLHAHTNADGFNRSIIDHCKMYHHLHSALWTHHNMHEALLPVRHQYAYMHQCNVIFCILSLIKIMWCSNFLSSNISYYEQKNIVIKTKYVILFKFQMPLVFHPGYNMK